MKTTEYGGTVQVEGATENLYPPGWSAENALTLKRAIDDSLLWATGGVRCFVRGPQTTSDVSETAALVREMRRSSPVAGFCDTGRYSDMPDFEGEQLPEICRPGNYSAKGGRDRGKHFAEYLRNKAVEEERRSETDRRMRESMGMNLPLEELTQEHLERMHRFAELCVGKLPKPENHT